MPISIVVGGQFGSEGKGKVALEIARRSLEPVTVVRVGGPNSGHTAYDRSGRKWALRQMPAACVDLNVDVVFPPGSYIDVALLFAEIDALKYPRERVWLSEYARIITSEHKEWERQAGLVDAIGSTGSGVGGAVIASVARGAKNIGLQSLDAGHDFALEPFRCDTSALMSKKLRQRQRIIVEGTQGFGLSLLEGGHWPKATARPTTAAGALAEASLSPLDVDDVTLVLRSFPIRVAGDSGPLTNETTWETIALNAGRADDLREYTTVTRNLRRVGIFDPTLARRALEVNHPSRVVMNHVDYIGDLQQLSIATSKVRRFVDYAETSLGRSIDWLGFSGVDVVETEGTFRG